MIRGKRIFKCNDCGKRFVDLDIELSASIFSVPQKCPKCGSMHTYPISIFNLGGILGPGRYRDIWKSQEDKDA